MLVGLDLQYLVAVFKVYILVAVRNLYKYYIINHQLHVTQNKINIVAVYHVT